MKKCVSILAALAGIFAALFVAAGPAAADTSVIGSGRYTWQTSSAFFFNRGTFSVTSGDGAHHVSFQSDGNFVVYHGTHATWQSGTGGRGLQIEFDYAGGISIAGTAPAAIWSNGIYNAPNSTWVLSMQNDGNLVEYLNGVAKWYTGTGGL